MNNVHTDEQVNTSLRAIEITSERIERFKKQVSQRCSAFNLFQDLEIEITLNWTDLRLAGEAT